MVNEFAEPDTVATQWSCLLQEFEFARHYYLINGPLNGNKRSPILDTLLPSLIYIRAVSILDDALARFIAQNNLTPDKNWYPSFGNRMRLLGSLQRFSAPRELERIKNKRNELAHNASANVSWSDTNAALDLIHEELRSLGFVDDQPNYELVVSRSTSNSSDPNAIAEIKTVFGLKSNGKELEIGYTVTEKVMKSTVE